MDSLLEIEGVCDSKQLTEKVINWINKRDDKDFNVSKFTQKISESSNEFYKVPIITMQCIHL